MVLKPPAKRLWAAELPRALWTGAKWWRGRALLAAQPRGDGLVNGLICRDEHGVSVEVRSSHLWVQHRPEVLAAAARALAAG